MDQQYVCTQCGEESDTQGPCPMCGLPMILAHDDDESDYDTSFDEEEEEGADKKTPDDDDDDDEEEASYNPYEEL